MMAMATDSEPKMTRNIIARTLVMPRRSEIVRFVENIVPSVPRLPLVEITWVRSI